MEFHNDKQGTFYLEVKVLKDLDCIDIQYQVDGRNGCFPISNKGYYAIYLGHFSFCKIEEYEDAEFNLKSWDPKLEGILRAYKNSLLETVEHSFQQFLIKSFCIQ
ncbi:MAG: hypothetical protein K2O22_00905 [Anaeroplasmataceae bacterium]|nr:hypothetical protein [Anaeroplasmataceae bacterium]